jgi:hypothetical protein
MRFKSFIFAVLFIAMQIQAASTVSGFSVAARWTPDGGPGKIWKYVITNGVTTQASVLFNGMGCFATINPDGQRVAFIVETQKSMFDGVWTNGYRVPVGIAVMSANGGAADTIVNDIADINRTFLDWPTGDWLYYGRGDTATDGSYSGMASTGNSLELWKINVNTKQKVKVCSFTNDAGACKVWQFGIANDGNKVAARPATPPVDDGIFGFKLSDFPGGVVKLSTSTNVICAWGCGTSISPDGNYVMWLTGRDHQEIAFASWNRTLIAKINLKAMIGWLTPGQKLFIDTTSNGGGTDANRWSCNDPKWICMCAGWNGRSGDGGSNQVLVNWVDHEIVRTSNDTECSPNYAPAPVVVGCRWQNETGDFWVGNPTPIVNQLTPPTIAPNGGNFIDSVRVTLTSATTGVRVFYTIDGTAPDSARIGFGGTAKIYSTPFKLTATATVMARAYKTGMLMSDSTRAVFTRTATTSIGPSIMAAKARSGGYDITVFDMLGRRVVNNATLTRGVYFVQVRDMQLRNAQGRCGNIIQTRKLVIQK